MSAVRVRNRTNHLALAEDTIVLLQNKVLATRIDTLVLKRATVEHIQLRQGITTATRIVRQIILSLVRINRIQHLQEAVQTDPLVTLAQDVQAHQEADQVEAVHQDHLGLDKYETTITECFHRAITCISSTI